MIRSIGLQVVVDCAYSARDPHQRPRSTPVLISADSILLCFVPLRIDVDNASTKPKPKRKSTDRSCQLGVKKKTFLGSYTTKWQCVKQSRAKNVPGYAFCTVCGCDFSVAHGGKNDVRRHIDSAKHKDNTVAAQSKSISSFFSTPKT